MGTPLVRRSRAQHLVSAGGVVFRFAEGGGLEVVLCGRKEPAVWALPKGTPDAGEDLEQTALREVREETGVEVRLREPIGNIQYWFVRGPDGDRCHKTVHFYLMSPTGAPLAAHDVEFDEVRWFSAEEALQVMTYPNEREIVRKALALAGASRT
ncbi:MAG: NUDIX hydrolase [Chloroflexi bacterium]|nr:NUDIX hydrolase [Chloroflexota bacterium]